MEKQKFKQTEIGEIPEDWEIKPIKELAYITTGSKNTQDRIAEGAYPFFVRSQTVERINSYSYEGEAVLTAGDGVGTGKVFHYINGKFDIHQRVYKISDFNNKLDGYFFFLYFSNNFFNRIMQMTAKSSVDSVRMEMIADMQIPVPTKSEQTTIATVLSDTDELITSLDKLIVKKKAMKQGAMQELLTGKKRLPGFEVKKGYKQTELGEIPEDWQVIKLGQVADITKLAGFEYTNYFNSYKDGGEIIVIRGTNITHDKLDLTDVKTIPRSTSNKLQRSKLSNHDLVFAYVGTIGPVFLIDKDDTYHLGPNTAKITTNNDISPMFIFTYFTSWLIKNEIIEHTSIGAQPSLSMTKIREFRIILSSTKAEQTAIATFFSDMDSELESLEKKRDKYLMIKQGMMQQLLTGKIRLI